MEAVRYRIRPRSAWRTPWQADTLGALLCALMARRHGPQRLVDEVLAPALQGRPAFVLSDACPGDLLPIPAVVRTLPWAPAHRRTVRSARWTSWTGLQQLVAGELPAEEPVLAHADAFVDAVRVRNTLDRLTQATPDEGGLWNADETWLAPGMQHLTVHARVEPAVRPLLDELFRELARTGYGADASAGSGQFDLEVLPPDQPWGDADAGQGGCMALGTYQPAAGDPLDGHWELFVKYGKLGMDLGEANVFKRPQPMLRPGACFRTLAPPLFLGRAIPAAELLPERPAATLAARGVHPVQPAFSLAIPIPWPAHS
jgi:CRISPR-associated protein Csm4